VAYPAAPAPRALIFDIGRVIVDVDLTRSLGRLGAGAGLSAEQVWAAIQADPRWREWQEGRIASRDWQAHLAHRFGLALSFEEFCTAWNSCLVRETILDEDLFAKLASRYRLGLLSNTDPIHVAHLETHFSFVRHFPVRVYSCTAGACKPELAIYRQAIRKINVAAEQILYVDDQPEYVAAGGQAGMQSIVFAGAEHMLGELRQRGLLL
jgi:glucose-1-phosphatase